MVEIGVIGGGYIATTHLETLESIDDANVVAICDVDEEVATQVAAEYGARPYTDVRTLYDDTSLDAAFVCVPPFAHGDPERLAAERGIDLFVEKPLALSLETAESIRTAIEESDVIAQVGYNWRFSQAVNRAADIIEDRDIGYVDGYWWNQFGGGEGWWRHAERSGGQTVEQATHIFDTIRYLVGDVHRVSAVGSHRIQEMVDFSDNTSANLEHENGAISHVSTSCVAERGKIGLEIVADGATIELSGVLGRSISGEVDGTEIEETYDHDPYADEVESFLDAVRTGDSSGIVTPYADALESFRVTLATNEAIESGESVRLNG